MRTQIKRLHMAFHATSVYVTHDQTEAMTLADRIVALRDGHIEQVGSPDDLYARPANRFIAGFIGSPTMNFLDARLEPRRRRPRGRAERRPVAEGAGLQDRALRRRTPASRSSSACGPRISPTPGPTSAARARTWCAIDLPVEITEPLGSDKLIFSRIGGTEIIGRVSAVETPPLGSTMRLNAHLNHMHLFDPASGATL